MNLQPEIIVISAELSHLPLEVNKQRTTSLYNALTDLGVLFKLVKGVYKNSIETSFVVLCGEDSVNFNRLQNLAITFSQESILHLDANRNATLIYDNGNREAIGVFRSVDKSTIVNLESYTYDASSDIYYACS